MGTARNRTIALLITLVALSAGCSREAGPSTPTAQLGTAPAEAPSTEAPSEAAESEPASEPADPYAIPADPNDIDAAYVERVLKVLTEPIADATRSVVRHDRLTSEARATLATTHRGEALAGITRAYARALRKAPARTIFSAKATPIKVSVEKVVGARRDCAFARVRQDTSGLAGKEIPPSTAYYQLGLKRSVDDPEGRNPTPWMIVVDAPAPGGGRKFSNPCA